MERKELIKEFFHNLDEYIAVCIEENEDKDNCRFNYHVDAMKKDAKENLAKSLEKVLDAK